MKKGEYKLNNGITIPSIGFGTWQIPNGDVCYNAVKDALEIGYRHIDTAIAYQNEESVGKAIKDSGLERKEVFITSKIPAEIKNYKEAKECIEASLKRLNVDYIDLMLIHAPRPWKEMFDKPTYLYKKENIEVYKALQEAYKNGKIKAIGVSNFSPDDLENIVTNFDIVPAVNQIRFHIGCRQEETLKYCYEHGILVEAYSPFQTGKILKDETLAKMANKYDVSVAKLCMQYCYQKGTLPLPKSIHYERIKANYFVDFNIELEDMKKLDEINF